MIRRYYLCPLQGAALCSLVRMARARIQPGLRILRFRLVCRKSVAVPALALALAIVCYILLLPRRRRLACIILYYD